MGMQGLRVGITADRKGAELAAALERNGALVTHGPTMSTVAPEDDDLLVGETEEMLAAAPGWIAVSTGSGVHAWLAAVETVGRREAVVEMLRSTKVVARGAKSLGALRPLGVEPVFVSPAETMDDVAAWLTDRVCLRDVVGVQEHGGEVIGSLATLRSKVAAIRTVTPYRWILPADRRPAEELVKELVDGSVDVLAATSAPSVRHLALIARGMGTEGRLIRSLKERVCVASVGPVTARAFEEMGVAVTVMPARSRTGDLIRAIAAWADRREDEPLLGGTGPLELVPSAHAVRIGAQVVLLGRQEFAVLAAMVRRPGLVIRPDVLALEAYGHKASESDAEIKHQVARIRRKLGDHGGCVQTVRQVGYRYAPDWVSTGG